MVLGRTFRHEETRVGNGRISIWVRGGMQKTRIRKEKQSVERGESVKSSQLGSKVANGQGKPAQMARGWSGFSPQGKCSVTVTHSTGHIPCLSGLRGSPRSTNEDGMP